MTFDHVHTIYTFWFIDNGPEQWWQHHPAFDQQILENFSVLHKQAAQCELSHWRASPKGRLAEIIILDQFSRNMFRDSARAYAYDSLALALAQEAVSNGSDALLTAIERSFIYMPFMHSESLKIHEFASQLFEQNNNPVQIDFELQHKRIIERFGRYPHRNKALTRSSTPEEFEFLKQTNSSF